MITREEAVKRIYSQKGKGIDKDGYYGFQCVDLIVWYLEDCLKVKSPHGNAKEWVHLPLPQGFTRTKNTLNFLPLPGDIVVWDNGTPYGHIGLVVKADLNTFTSMEQNVINNITTGSPAELVTHTNWGNTWFIRPPFSTNNKQSTTKNNLLITKISTKKKMSRNGWIPDIIVNHITEGGYDGAVGWLSTGAGEVSSNFATARDGRVSEIVPITEAAWCNGTQSFNSSRMYYTGRSTNHLIRSRNVNANLYTVSIEHEGWTGKTDGRLTEEQYKSTLELHKFTINEIKRIYGKDFIIDRSHIIGHSEVSPREKPNCPGKYFPFERLINDLRTWKGLRPADKKFDPEGLFNARVITISTEVKKGPGNHYMTVKQLYKDGIYTVTEVNGVWGRLKSCKDWWINLEDTKREEIQEKR